MCPFCVAFVVGAVIGGGIDLGSQVLGNAIEGCGLFDDLDWGNVVQSGLIGGGLSVGGAWVSSGRAGAALGRINWADDIGAIGVPRAPSGIAGYTRHGLQQAIGRDGGLGVAPHAILDAVRTGRPVWQQSTQTFKYVGRDATVFLNTQGRVVTTWARSSRGWR